MSKPHTLILPVSILIAWQQAAQAQSAGAEQTPQPQGVQSCTSLKNRSLRLDCFDRLFADTEVAGETPAPEAAAVSPPLENLHKSPLDLAQSYIASKESRSPQIVLAEKAMPAPAAERTPLSELYDLDENSADGLLSIREHHPTYIMPAWYNSSPNYRPVSPTRGRAVNEIQSQQKRKPSCKFRSKPS